jgi:hypothetical protein
MPISNAGKRMIRKVVFGIAILNLLMLMLTFTVFVGFFLFVSLFVDTALLIVLSYFVMREKNDVRDQNEVNEQLIANVEKLEKRMKELEERLSQSGESS